MFPNLMSTSVLTFLGCYSARGRLDIVRTFQGHDAEVARTVPIAGDLLPTGPRYCGARPAGWERRHAKGIGPVEGSQDQVHASAAKFVEVLADRRESRGEVAGFRGVVEADDTDLVGHAVSGLIESEKQAKRHLVVRNEDSGDVGIGGDS